MKMEIILVSKILTINYTHIIIACSHIFNVENNEDTILQSLFISVKSCMGYVNYFFKNFSSLCNHTPAHFTEKYPSFGRILIFKVAFNKEESDSDVWIWNSLIDKTAFELWDADKNIWQIVDFVFANRNEAEITERYLQYTFA